MRMLIFLLGIVALTLSQEVGKVEKFSGKVDRLQKGQVRPQPITAPNTGLTVGDVVRTKSDGNANVSFVDGSRAELGPLTRLDVLEYKEIKSVNVTRGRVLFEVTKLKPGEGFEVRTPTAILGVKGTRFSVEVGPSYTRLKVLSGNVEVTPIGGQNLRFLATEGTAYEVGTQQANRLDSQPDQQQNQRQTEYRTPPPSDIRQPCIR
ncbi:MAG: FecR family protein [Aquificaceae bacterium]|nr:FecR family protein [Aquificaceae bacterium]